MATKPKHRPRSVDKTHAATPDGPLFATKLGDEVGPSLVTAKTLHTLAMQLFELRPWDFLHETQLIVVGGAHHHHNTPTKELCYCSIMGSLGELFAMHVWVGPESYRLFRKLSTGKVKTAIEFYRTQQSVQVEFVPRREADVEDRKLLAAVGHPQKRADLLPVFRAIRPGFQPWYLTEDEALTLTACLRVVIDVCAKMAGPEAANYWPEENVYPMVSLEKEDAKCQDFNLALVEVSLSPEPALPAVFLTPGGLKSVADLKPGTMVVELDYAMSESLIGEKNKRPGFICMTLAADARTGIILATEVGDPSTRPEHALVEALLKTMSATRAVPAEVHVYDTRYQKCLAEVAEACGFQIKVKRSLPALEAARAALKRAKLI